MERGKPLARKTPLSGGKRLERGTSKLAPGKPLARTAPKPRATPIESKPSTSKPRTQRATGPTQTERATVRDRDRDACVRCGGPGSNDHHRVGRGMGGRSATLRAETNAPSRRLTLCGSGTTGCHGWVTENPTEAERLGYVVRRARESDCPMTPVLTLHGWRLFTDDARSTPCPPPPGGDAREAASDAA